jgi:hypothetical protein
MMMRVCRVVFHSFALATVGAQTTWTATWHSSQSGTGRPMSIWGYTPDAASDETFQVPANETTTATTHPLYVWVTGTHTIFNGPADKDNAIEMAKKGFVDIREVEVEARGRLVAGRRMPRSSSSSRRSSDTSDDDDDRGSRSHSRSQSRVETRATQSLRPGSPGTRACPNPKVQD